MGWIDTVWPMVAGTSLALGLAYLLVWLRQPHEHGYLLFFMLAAAVAAFSILELRMMRAATPEQYAVLLRWAHVPVLVAFVSMVGFVLVWLRSGRWWLGVGVCGLRSASLVLNFTTGVNLNWQQVTGMVPVALWGGDTVFVPIGVLNPWVIVGQLSNLLLVVFVADASITLWRRRGADARRRALVVGGTMVLFPLCAAVLAGLYNTGAVRAPYTLSLLFLMVVVAMAFELGSSVVYAARLSVQLRLNETSLRESERRLQLAASAGHLGLWDWNVGEDEVWMTRECRALFGFALNEPIDLGRFLAVVHPEDRAAVEHGVAEALRKDNADDLEQDFRIMLPGGSIRCVRSRGRVERDDTGGVLRMRGVSQDVTARRQAEQRFRTLVEAAPSAILVIRADGTIVSANARAESMFGYLRDELIGLSIDALVPARFQPGHRALLEAYRREEQRHDLRPGRDLFALRNDGTEVAVEVSLSRLPSDDGALVLAYVVDVSQRKQEELEAARQRDELAHLARVTMLGELSGSLAHELNQPLSAILGNAQAAQRFLARDPPQVDDVRAALTDIVGSGKRAGAVIARLRSLMRKEEARHRPLDLNEVVHEVLSLMRSDLLNRQVTVHTELVDALPAVSGDRVQLQQVLLNLLINACDAVADIDAPREIVVRSEPALGGQVSVSVVDHGPGIPPADLERIFEPFMTTRPDGMGLGLAVCRTIVRSHGGRLWAANAPSGGAILHVELPAIRA